MTTVDQCVWCGRPDCPTRDEHERAHQGSETSWWRRAKTRAVGRAAVMQPGERVASHGDVRAVAAISIGYSALGYYGQTGDVNFLINGILDMRNRLREDT